MSLNRRVLCGVLVCGLIQGIMASMPFASDPVQITLLATNDIHGHVSEKTQKDGSPWGGLLQWGAIATAIRKGVEARGGGVLLLDGGDQFQGTLLSNFDEGELVIDLMSEMNYDAVVPGNHDYDFGPLGWLEDQVAPGAGPTADPRGALRALQQRARFPLISANTYYASSLRDAFSGAPVTVVSKGCEALPAADLNSAGEAPVIDWSQAQRLELVEPYRLVTLANGVRVALIGIDHEGTGTMTTVQNVQDLCFRNEADAYLSVWQELRDRADVFVMVIHGGNIQQDQGLTQLVQKITTSQPGALHAVIGGHTHSVNREVVNGVPLIQSGAHGERFGRIDLFWDPATRSLVGEKLRVDAGIPIFAKSCPREAAGYCGVTEQGVIHYEGVAAVRNERMEARVRQAQENLSPLADRVLGKSEGALTRNRTQESSMSNAMTDALRELSGAQIALLNSSGLRADLPSGAFNYAQLFEVLPFNNRAVVLESVRFDTLKKLLLKSVQSCGAYGALLPSGLRVAFERDCSSAQGKTDPAARLTRVELLDSATGLVAEVLLGKDAAGQDFEVPAERSFRVATLDFLASGGSGYADFKEARVTEDLGVFRETLATRLQSIPARWSSRLDGRFRETKPRGASRR
jgi:5'-nucleotidase